MQDPEVTTHAHIYICTVMSLLEAPSLIEAPPQVSLHIVTE